MILILDLCTYALHLALEFVYTSLKDWIGLDFGLFILLHLEAICRAFFWSFVNLLCDLVYLTYLIPPGLSLHIPAVWVLFFGVIVIVTDQLINSSMAQVSLVPSAECL